MTAVGQLAWDDGALVASSPRLPARAWTRPADLAAARLAIEPPVSELALATGADLLTAAFAVVPFVAAPLPQPVFGDAVTPAAQAAFLLFLGSPALEPCRVLRGAPDDFLVCARCAHGVWSVGAFTVAPTTLTVRFEDLWRCLPAADRARTYAVDVVRDPNAADDAAAQAAGVVRETLADVAPDARLFIELARSGGFTLTFRPVPADLQP